MLQVENISIKKCYSGWHKEPGNFFAAATGAVFPFFYKFLLLQLQKAKDQRWSNLSKKGN